MTRRKSSNEGPAKILNDKLLITLDSPPRYSMGIVRIEEFKTVVRMMKRDELPDKG